MTIAQRSISMQPYREIYAGTKQEKAQGAALRLVKMTATRCLKLVHNLV